jgi:hypothetical protein
MGRKEISTNREGREFPFAVLQPLAQLLKDQRDRTSELEHKQGRIFLTSFIGTVDRLDRTFAPGRACDAAKLNGRLVHDLR